MAEPRDISSYVNNSTWRGVMLPTARRTPDTWAVVCIMGKGGIGWLCGEATNEIDLLRIIDTHLKRYSNDHIDWITVLRPDGAVWLSGQDLGRMLRARTVLSRSG